MLQKYFLRLYLKHKHFEKTSGTRVENLEIEEQFEMIEGHEVLAL